MPPSTSHPEAPQDARLVAAFERGRLAEHERLAQDLHDDLGARLLTLIVRAREPEMVESLRDTLRDLKALARGLSTARTQLGEAMADWKHEACERAQEAGIAMSGEVDGGPGTRLGTEQWFALTRVLRELVSNAIVHAQPSRISVAGRLDEGWLELEIEDDGHGHAPGAWAQGMGVSGVRRRIAALGGSVRWADRLPHGIRCTVRVPLPGPSDATLRDGQEAAG
ncbi:MAG: sensor histidine kinase [Rubrivivax sp.]